MAINTKSAVAEILDRRRHYEIALDYYEGRVPETFASAKLKRAFKVTGDSSRLNFCRPVVDAVNDRLEIADISAKSEKATNAIKKVWDDNELSLEAQEIHRRTLVYGDCYVIVWPNPETGEIEVGYNSPTDMVMVYDPENPRKKLYAVKIWMPDEQTTRMDLYTREAIYRYSARAAFLTEGLNWDLVETVDNPFGEIPVFHFRTHRPFGRPEHYDGYDTQNAINKLFVTSMFTVDYQGAPQRYALAQMDDSQLSDWDEDSSDRQNIEAMKSGPGQLWYMKGVAQVGEFKPADPATFWDPIHDSINSMAALTGTPLHYFERTNLQTGNALRASEAPLLKKVGDRQISFGATWTELFKFVLKVEKVNSAGLQVYWKTLESLDEVERWDVTLKKINAGLSYRQALREGGYSDKAIDKIMTERQEEYAMGLYYQRAPQARQSTQNETNAVVDNSNPERNGTDG